MSGSIDDLAARIREAEGGRERLLEKFTVFCALAFFSPGSGVTQVRADGRDRGVFPRFKTRIFKLRREDFMVVAGIAYEVRCVVISRKQVPVRDWTVQLRQKMHEAGRLFRGRGRLWRD
ncbi:hypothetical protein [Gluconobacter sphaericus]|uniref:hypothetical protein n=1 Tax=Gluconobacter sphaericus TaxID=574987 RepID=UPI00312B3D57